jgi:hypothetical protein
LAQRDRILNKDGQNSHHRRTEYSSQRNTIPLIEGQNSQHRETEYSIQREGQRKSGGSSGKHGGSSGSVVAQLWEAWWLNGSVPDCCPAVPGSNPMSPQPTADCKSPGGLPPGMALGCGLTSVKGDRGEYYEK